jgi:nitric oxide dioxygenase
MSPHEIKLVCASWNDAAPVADTVARTFYRRLFQLAPELRSRFRTSMSSQGDQLVAALDDLTESLASGETPCVIPASMDPRYADVIAKAWTWTLRQELGRKAPIATRKAWRVMLSTPAAAPLYAVAMGELELAVAG